LAVEQLLDKIKGESEHVVKKFIIDPVLVIRKTCGYSARQDHDPKQAYNPDTLTEKSFES
jgi:hypothetical protein